MSGNIHLSPRLEAIKNLVRKNSVVADIGCDHAQLICALAESGIATRGFACEANLKPLERAKRTINENCLSNRIHTVLTNGLTDLPHREIDVIIIAGMGGDLISGILLAHPWTRDSRFQFILQPMSKAENLRKSLFENGFAISSERAVISDNKVYTVIDVTYTDCICYPGLLTCYAGRVLENNDFPSGLYIRQVLRRVETRATGLERAGNLEEAEKFRLLAAQIRERMQ